MRSRASKDGPKAFGSVNQEDVFTFFSYDATEKSSSSKNRKPENGGGKGKRRPAPDKICLKFNQEGGCNFRNCVYFHKCLICEEQGHGKRGRMFGKKTPK